MADLMTGGPGAARPPSVLSSLGELVAKALIITEKPSVARDIAACLGGFAEQEGYYESDRYVLTWAVGHLFELLEPEEIDENYRRWTLDNLPIIPAEFKTKPKQGQTQRVRLIKKLLEREDVDTVINACDAGREGELIFREIVEHFGSTKPIRRLWLQSMTEEAIRTGFSRLRPGEELEGLAAAAGARARTDWLIGMNATRVLTKRLKGRREKGAWSAGRVQTPTLALLVDRELEVLVHVPRAYWRLVGSFEHDGNVYQGTWFDPALEGADDEARDDRIFDEVRAQAVAAAVQGRRGEAEETRKPSRESAPPLFDLTSLQREAIRRFGWTARRTLSAAQRCYEAHKLLTYPRTDSRCLPNDYRGNVQEVLRAFADAGRGRRSGAQDADPIAEYGVAASRLLEQGLENEGRTFDDSKVSDHFAIVPTGRLPGPALSGDDKRLFDLVTRRFLSTFHPPATWERVERTTRVAGERFRSRARTLVEPGWRAVLEGGATADAGDDVAVLPPLRPGAAEASGVAVANQGIELIAEQTKPPPRITEARLLSLMENAGQDLEDEDLAAAMHERGLGTPATRAEIIENLIAKGYVVRLGRALRPTAKGIRLIDILKRIHIDRLTSAELTGEMELHLNQVEQGERAASDFMQEIEDYTREIVDHAKSFEYEDLYAKDPPLGECPRCQRPVVEGPWFYRCQEEPARDPDCPLRIWKDTSGRYIDRASAAALLRDGRTPTLEGFTARNGRTYQGILEIDRDEWAVRVRAVAWEDGQVREDPEYEVNPEPLAACPFEEECSVVESPTQFVCERKLKENGEGGDAGERPKSCGFALPRTVCKREITREEALSYLANGRSDLLTDFTSRYGRPFSATLVLRKNGRHGFEFPPRPSRKGAPEAPPAEGAGEAAAGSAAPARKPARRRRPGRAKPAAPAAAATPATAEAPRKGGRSRAAGGKKAAVARRPAVRRSRKPEAPAE
jgi:DNA topoisomerase-3